MAKKPAAQSLFDDGSMTFGEHIEELRAHLMRAIWGILAATAFTILFAHKVVEVLTYPLQGKLEEYHVRRLTRLSDEYVRTERNLPADQRSKVEVTATVASESVAKLLGKPPADDAPIDLKLTMPAAELVQGLALPLARVNQPWTVRTLSAQEPFIMYFKAAIGAAIVLACPWVVYQIYAFVAVGLYAHERRFVQSTVPFSVGLFLIGIAFCYFVMLPLMLHFLIGANEWIGSQPDIRLNEWIGFCVLLMIVFGAAFQLPMLMLVLERTGVVNHKMLSDKRRHAVLGIFVFAAIATPTPDPVSQIILAVPLYGLYELGLFLMRYGRRRVAVDAETGETPALDRPFDDLLQEHVTGLVGART